MTSFAALCGIKKNKPQPGNRLGLVLSLVGADDNGAEAGSFRGTGFGNAVILFVPAFVRVAAVGLEHGVNCNFGRVVVAAFCSVDQNDHVSVLGTDSFEFCNDFADGA